MVKTNHVLVIKPHHFDPATDDPEEADWEWDGYILCLDRHRSFCTLWFVCDECRGRGITKHDVDLAPKVRGVPQLHGEGHGFSGGCNGLPLRDGHRCLSTADSVMDYVANELPGHIGPGRWYCTITYDEDGDLCVNILDPIPDGEEARAQ